MIALDQINGAHVDLVSFGIAHFMLAFTKDDVSFSVSSSADVSFDASNPKVDFRDLDAPTGLTGIVGKHLSSVEHSEDFRSGELRFEEGPVVFFNWPDAIYDNLFVLRFEGSDEWTVIG